MPDRDPLQVEVEMLPYEDAGCSNRWSKESLDGRAVTIIYCGHPAAWHDATPINGPAVQGLCSAVGCRCARFVPDITPAARAALLAGKDQTWESDHAIGEAIAVVVAAARSWHTLSNPSNELVERVAEAIYTKKWGPSMSGPNPGAMERDMAYSVIEAVRVTGENPQ